MSSVEVMLWPIIVVALLVIGLQALVRRHPSIRPWLLTVAVINLAGYVTWAIATPGPWRNHVVLAIFLAYALWTSEVLARARERRA